MVVVDLLLFAGRIVLVAMLYVFLFTTMKTDSFLMAHRQLKQYLARSKKNTEAQKMLEIEAEMQLGVYYAKMVGLMDSAQLHNQQALRLAQQSPSYDRSRLMILCNMADAYKQMGRYDQCIAYFNKAYELGDSLGISDDTRITIASGVASAYSSMKSFEQSDIWWNRAEQLMPKMSKVQLFNYLNNRGNNLFLQEKYAESLDYFLRLDSIIKDDPSMIWERMFEHCNLSGLYIKLGQADKAKPILEETERFFTEQQQPIPLFYLTTQRIEIALQEKDYALAQRLADENETPDWMIPDQTMLRQEVLINLYEKTGEWKKKAMTQQSYYGLRDSIANNNLKMYLALTQIVYEHERNLIKKQKQIDQKEEDFRWTLALLIGSIVIIILLSTIIVQKVREARLKESVTKNQIQSLRMEVVRNRITPHFIGNVLSAELMAQAEGREVNLNGIVELLHRGIEFTGTEQTTLHDELEFIEFYCNIESRNIGPDFCYETQIAPDVDTNKVILPAMTVQILVENSLKHGLRAKKPQPGTQRKVTVKTSRKEAATLIEILDNGIGLPEEWQKRMRTGLKAIYQMLIVLNEQNRNQIDFGMENRTDQPGTTGCHAWLLLPDDYDYKLKT